MDTMKDEQRAFESWLKQGVDAGWASDSFCEAHDGPPFTSEEQELLRADPDSDMDILDRCMPAVRLFPPNAKEAIDE